MVEKKINWGFLLVEGLVSMAFSLMISTAGSIVSYSMFTSLAERGQDVWFDMNYLQAAPRLSAAVYGLFFFLALLSFTRLRIYERAVSRPRAHWILALIFYGLIGVMPGLIYWLLLSAADRPGI